VVRFLSEQQLLFLHIPRTGGTWIESAIEMTVGKGNYERWLFAQPESIPKKHGMLPHLKSDRMNRARNVFTFVRHPKAYYESTWKYLSDIRRVAMRTLLFKGKYKTEWKWHPHHTAAVHYLPTFDDWVFLMTKHEPMWYTRMVEAYIGPAGGEFVQFIGRTESLADDFIEAMHGFGYGKQVKRVEKKLRAKPPANTAQGVCEWSNDMLAKVMETERPVIERFYGEEKQLWFSEIT